MGEHSKPIFKPIPVRRQNMYTTEAWEANKGKAQNKQEQSQRGKKTRKTETNTTLSQHDLKQKQMGSTNKSYLGCSFFFFFKEGVGVGTVTKIRTCCRHHLTLTPSPSLKLKGDPREDAGWHENAENIQTLPFAGFMWLCSSIQKHQQASEYCLLFQIYPWAASLVVQPQNDNWKKVWLRTQYTSVPHVKWPCSWRQRHKHCQRQNGSIQGGVFANFKHQCLTIVCYKNNRLKNWCHTWNGLVHDVKDAARQNGSIYGGVFASFKCQCLPIVRYKNNSLKNLSFFIPTLF